MHSHLLGHLTSLQVHHIFPKAVLYDAEYHRSQVNAVANFCFLTQDTNLAIGMRKPEDYFEEAETKNPGVLASQWIPKDPALWRVERYPDFLAARRELLARAANTFLGGLRAGASPGTTAALERVQAVVDCQPTRTRPDEIAALIAELTELAAPSQPWTAKSPTPRRGGCWPSPRHAGQRACSRARAILSCWNSIPRNPTSPGSRNSDTKSSPRSSRSVAMSAAATRKRPGRSGSEPPPATGAGAQRGLPACPARAEPGPHVRAAFEQAMRNVYVRAKSEANYTAASF